MIFNVTLDDLVDAVFEFAHSDAEVVATVMHMLAKGGASVDDADATARVDRGQDRDRH
jgi:hypothetical protein